MAGGSAARPPPNAGSGKSTRRWIVPVVLVATLGVIAGVILVVTIPRLNGSGNAGDGAIPGVGADPGVAHVHGLGVDPGDGTLYAATHYGVFRIPASGTATRIADRYQDTMGFTVLGPRHFLGSGHPDLREDKPSRLGLIESTDAGQSWQPCHSKARPTSTR